MSRIDNKYKNSELGDLFIAILFKYLIVVDASECLCF